MGCYVGGLAEYLATSLAAMDLEKELKDMYKAVQNQELTFGVVFFLGVSKRSERSYSSN